MAQDDESCRHIGRLNYTKRIASLKVMSRDRPLLLRGAVNPYPAYDHFRRLSPVVQDPGTGFWMAFSYDAVKRVLQDHHAFSSRHGPADWMIFLDPPRHSKLRALVAQAFTPRSVANLEPRIRDLSRELLDLTIERGAMDLATDFAVPLPMMVIAEMLGIPVADRPRFVRWNDAILAMSRALVGAGETARAAIAEFTVVTLEMSVYLAELLDHRRSAPSDDLLTRLLHAELDGERLNEREILGFFQLLLLAGSETTTNLINNADPLLPRPPGAACPTQRRARTAPWGDRGSAPLPRSAPVDVPRADARGRARRPDRPRREACARDDRLGEP